MYMPKVDIDYSNTIFYKIFCKDPTIKELYVGLTTNFVQRKHAHKQSCKNEKAINHNCKLYSAIRNAGGWDNWQMEIIAFHNCADSYEARKKEQCYFEMLGATLNSIDPFPKPKIKEHPAKIIKEKNILFCEPCNVHFSHWKTQETHNNTKKHHKMALSQGTTAITPKNAEKFYCDACHFNCCKNSDWKRHLTTTKHINTDITLTHVTKANAGSSSVVNKFICECGKSYKHRQSLFNHRKQCNIAENEELIGVTPKLTEIQELKESMKCLIKENIVLKNMMIDVIKNGTCKK
jgi:hypothetical protein